MKKEMLTLRFALRAAALLVACAAVLGFSMRAESAAMTPMNGNEVAEEYVVPDGVKTLDNETLQDVRAKRIVVPESVEEIRLEDVSLFYLEEWQVAEGNAHFKSIDGVLFSKDGTKLLNYPSEKPIVDEYVVPEGTKTFLVKGSHQFRKLVLPESFEEFALYDEDSFGKLWIYDEWQVAEGNAHFKSIDGILFSKDGTRLLSYPRRKALSSYVVPDGVRQIARCAFDRSELLRTVVIPSSVEKVGDYAFNECASLISVVFETELIATQDAEGADSDAETGEVEWKGVKSIGSNAFEKCNNLAVVELPESLEEIGKRAFLGCRRLVWINSSGMGNDIPHNVKEIKEDTFSTCLSLTRIGFPDGLKKIRSGAFWACFHLSRVDLNLVEEIDKSVFSDCDELHVSLNEDNPAFKLVDEVLFSKDGSRLLYYPRDREECVVPEGTTKIDAGVFAGNNRLRSISLPSSLEEMETNAFWRCDALERIEVAESNAKWKSVDGVLFSKDGTELIAYPPNKQDAEYAVPEGTTKIDADVFAGEDSGNNRLRSISLPASLEEMETNAFWRCDALERIEVAESNAKWKSVDGVLFSKDGTELIAYPPNKQDAEYAVPEGTTKIAHHITPGLRAPIRGEVREFKHVFRLRSISLPSSLEEMETNAFWLCDALERIEVAESNAKLKSVDGVLFSKDGMELIAYPRNKQDAEYAVPEGTTKIERYAFYGCKSLESVYIPKSVTSIDPWASPRLVFPSETEIRAEPGSYAEEWAKGTKIRGYAGVIK